MWQEIKMRIKAVRLPDRVYFFVIISLRSLWEIVPIRDIWGQAADIIKINPLRYRVIRK